MDDTPTKPPRDRSPRDDETIPNEDPRAAADPATDSDADHRPRYRSWKKKWRKLRVTFDAKMHEAEVLWTQEQKAKATIKRIAVENDRLLDLLSDINASSQIPPEKRIAISPPKSPSSPQPTKILATLESEVPHLPLSQAADSFPTLRSDTAPAPGEDAPAPFLTADELENYLYEADRRVGLPRQPTLAPAASHEAPAGSRDFLVKHPHSAYNWLKINAPQVFLQNEDENRKERKSQGGQRGGKRGKAREEEGEVEEDEEGGRKRKRDEGDAGYRPKGGGNRPVKRKRKSEGEVKRRRVGE